MNTLTFYWRDDMNESLKYNEVFGGPGICWNGNEYRAVLDDLVDEAAKRVASGSLIIDGSFYDKIDAVHVACEKSGCDPLPLVCDLWRTLLADHYLALLELAHATKYGSAAS